MDSEQVFDGVSQYTWDISRLTNEKGGSRKETDACMCAACLNHLVASVRMNDGSLGSRNLGNQFTERENDKTPSLLLLLLFENSWGQPRKN